MPIRRWTIGGAAAAALLATVLGAATASAQRIEGARLPSLAAKALQEEAAGHYREGRFAAAMAASERAVAAIRAEFGSDHEHLAIQLYGLAHAAEAAGRLDIAEQALRENVRIGEKVYGRDSVLTAQGLERLGEVLVGLGRPADAEPLLRRALDLRVGVTGPENSFAASSHAALGAMSLARADARAALASYREAVRLLTARRETQTLAAHVMESEIRRLLPAFTGHADAAWQVARQGGDVGALTGETFTVAQRAWTTAAASAVSRMSARLAAGETELGRRIRRQQDAAERVLALHQEDNRELARWSEVQRRDPAYSGLLERFRQASIDQHRDNAPAIKRQTELVQALQEHLARCPPGQRRSGCDKAESERSVITKELGQLSEATSRGSGALMAIHREMEAAEARLPGHAAFHSARQARIAEQTRLEQVVAAERKAIVASFPDYLALTEPEPLAVAAVQALLGPTEALVTLLVGRDRTFIWAVTRERVQWTRVEAGASLLAEHVAALRRGLDPLSEPAGGAAAGGEAAFDLARAHALYRLVLAPVEDLIRDKTNLILVPTGPLTSLPFQVLLTAPPPAAASPAEALRRAPWLVRRHATSVLPSVPSLSALRRVGAALEAAEPFLGVGDPVLKGPLPGTGRSGASPPSTLASLYRNGVPDLRALQQLAPLPETAAEIRAIATALRAPEDAMLLGAAATETRVRRSPLERYRVIHFATHGLVAGELSGLAEPALVLTPPLRASEEDDGLLTASEVAALRLRADWVVLSACNTASGSDAGAEALSGLARAFFFAGARALLVSHWAVHSEATVWLTTRTFETIAREPAIGRAEAFRRTMLEMIDGNQAPSRWAAFVIVGEGSARR